jgi:hypothetical protein
MSPSTTACSSTGRTPVRVTVTNPDGKVMSTFQGKVNVNWQSDGPACPTVEVQSGNACEKITGGGIDDAGADDCEVYLDEIKNPTHQYYDNPQTPDHPIDTSFDAYGKPQPGPGVVSNGGSLLTYHDTPC